MPGAVRASAGINTTENDVARLLAAVARIAGGDTPPVPYRQDPHTGGSLRRYPRAGAARFSPGSLLARIGTLAT